MVLLVLWFVSYDTIIGFLEMTMINLKPTEEAYAELQKVYDHFNRELFGGRLPPCLIIHARKGQTFGYYSPDRWQRSGQSRQIDEIALNPQHFRTRSVEEVLSTLAHEMTHLEHHHFGKPGRKGYHTREWGDLMRAIGLYPSHTGKPGGKETGQQMSHNILKDGQFEKSVSNLIKEGFSLSWSDTIQEVPGEEVTTNPRKKSKWKFTCSECGQNSWGKSDTKIICGFDMKPMICPELESDGEGATVTT
ncbi:MAG: sprT domain-containing protein [Sulfitobacter sp.]|nr:MAG: sprT domain-containing protein [Sulfitobacter sp.]